MIYQHFYYFDFRIILGFSLWFYDIFNFIVTSLFCLYVINKFKIKKQLYSKLWVDLTRTFECRVTVQLCKHNNHFRLLNMFHGSQKSNIPVYTDFNLSLHLCDCMQSRIMFARQHSQYSNLPIMKRRLEVFFYSISVYSFTQNSNLIIRHKIISLRALFQYQTSSKYGCNILLLILRQSNINWLRNLIELTILWCVKKVV